MAEPKLAWGGFSNGQIPRANLVDIGDGKLLQADAASNWRKFTAAFRAHWGAALYLADNQDAYRDIAEQQYMWDHRNDGPPHPSKVARPGASIHGWARSVDCTGYGQGGSARHNWMVDNGKYYGWSWDYGRSLKEPWHWDYVGPITTTAGDGGVTPFERTKHMGFDPTRPLYCHIETARFAVLDLLTKTVRLIEIGDWETVLINEEIDRVKAAIKNGTATELDLPFRYIYDQQWQAAFADFDYLTYPVQRPPAPAPVGGLTAEQDARLKATSTSEEVKVVGAAVGKIKIPTSGTITLTP